jgi:hypothetical protein
MNHKMLVKLTLLFAVAFVLLTSVASASSGCPLCITHGCATKDGASSDGCFCHYVKGKCTLGGCPCLCEGNEMTGIDCVCQCNGVVQSLATPGARFGAPAPLPNSSVKPAPRKRMPTVAEVKKEYVKLFLLDPPGQLELFRMGSAQCPNGKGNDIYMAGWIAAAAETGHPIKFVVIGTETVQDKIDAGEPLE